MIRDMTLLIKPNDFDYSNQLPLATKKRWNIPNIKAPPLIGLHLEQAVRETKSLQRKYSGKLRSFDTTYNCVGMVFGNRRVQIEDKHAQRILDDDGYYRVEESHVVLNDVIAYRKIHNRNIIHVGVVCEIIISSAE